MFDLSNTKPHVFLPIWAPVSVGLAILVGHTLGVLPGVNWLMPWLSAIVVFYWSLKGRGQLHVAEIFFLGLLQDVFSGLPLGVHSAAFILMHFMVTWQFVKLQHAPFLKVWVAFAGVLAAAIGLLLAVLWAAGTPPTFWVVAVWFSTILAFPGVFFLLFISHKKLVV